jgi:hypothetical protein
MPGWPWGQPGRRRTGDTPLQPYPFADGGECWPEYICGDAGSNPEHQADVVGTIRVFTGDGHECRGNYSL